MHIAPDEKIQDLKLEGFDARRDRWNGYDTAEYVRVVDRRALCLCTWPLLCALLEGSAQQPPARESTPAELS